MGGIFKAPKIPAPPPIQAPPEPDFSADDEAMKKAAEEEQKKRDLKRKGRRSTILTGTGLAEIEDENIEQKTLLGG
jgi:hypothetical protein